MFTRDTKSYYLIITKLFYKTIYIDIDKYLYTIGCTITNNYRFNQIDKDSEIIIYIYI